MKKNIFNINFTESFLDIISVKLLEETKDNIESLSEYLLLLPNKRTIKTLQESFLRNSQSLAMILPKMVSLQDLDYIFSSPELLNSPLLEQDEFKDIFKKSISRRKRSFILAKLIQQKERTLSINQSIFMAESLGSILDDSYFEHIDFNNLENIVDANLANHWQEILKFLYIVTDVYPNILKELDVVDAAYKQTLTYKLQNELWKISPPKHPILALNITSYHEDVINILNSISTMKQGKIIFYGVDFKLEEKTIKYQHPQKIIEHMLNKMKVDKADIQPFSKKTSSSIKENFIHRLFDNTTHKKFKKKDIKDIVNNLSILVAKNSEEEAKSIALLLRETLEIPEKTIGVITSNKSLINRIINELKRWDLEVNDYLGESLNKSINAKFFMLVGELINTGFEPNLLLSLLKNPLAKFKETRATLSHITENLDLHVLRKPLNKFSLNEIISLCKNSRLDDKPKKQVIHLLITLKEYTKEFAPVIKNPNKNYVFKDLLIKHIELAEKISQNIEGNPLENDLWAFQEGKQLSTLLSELLEESEYLDVLSFPEYLGIIENSLKEINVHQIYNKHPRIYIYGALQSNLVHHDIMIVASLNEDSMPKLLAPNPWLNKYMSKTLGFIPKESKLGEQSNIFCQNLGASEVILTHSEKEKGTITAPSRWLLRLQTFLEYYNIKEVSNKSHIYDIQGSIDLPKIYNTNNMEKPSFNPNIEARPTKIPVTKLELLIQNPYVFFIDRILNLKILENINPDITHKVYGSNIHAILEEFFLDYTKNQVLNLEEQNKVLENLFHKHFDKVGNTINFQVFTKPIALNSLNKFSVWNFEYFKNIKNIHLEIDGQINFHINNKDILLTGKADRIDILENEINIIDYKTSKAKVEIYQKQLFVLSIILKEGGFKEIPFTKLNLDAQYIFIPKNMSAKIENKNIQSITKNTNILDVLEESEKEIIALLENYYLNLIPYEFSNEKNISKEYLHFSRFDEWNTSIENLIQEDDEGEEQDEK